MADSGGGGSADSYIGSLISLTSKSEIRYEGLLYTVDTENSNIALQNVRSFGTEGRKKDGPQIPSSDKVYEFIIFRGTDIKDLQVKMSPPPPIHNDPAIISLQAQASQPLSAPPPYIPPVADLIGHHSTYKASPVPYYHSASSGVALWAPPPPPQGPLSGNMPLYWQGFYGPPDQHRLMEPPSASVPAPTVAQGISVPLTPAIQSPSAPSGQDQTSAPPVLASTFTLSPPSHSAFSPEFSRVGSTAVPAVEPVNSNRLGFGTPLPFSSSQPTSLSSPNVVSCGLVHEGNGPDVQPSKLDEIKVQPHHDVCSVGPSGVSSASMSSPAPSTGRKGSFLPGKSPMVYKPVYKQVQVTKDHLNSGHRISAPKLQPPSAQPLLPLPVSPTQHKPFLQVHEGISMTSPMRRGGSRGRGIGRASRSVPSRSKVLEDFDFIAMNEKFNKEEVWDELLKVESKDRVSEETGATQGLEYGLKSKETERVFDGSLSELSRRSVYVKDDFFDSLSCDSLGREHGRQERIKFSEQRKIDTETFGSFHVRSYRGGGGYRGRRGSSGGRRNVGRSQGHGFGYYNVSRSDGRPVG